jgi:hypothetical protein
MQRDSDRAWTIGGGRPSVRLATALVVICCALGLPAGALADNLFSLDSQAATVGPIATESKGDGYVAWERKATSPSEADTTFFCKIPRGGSCTSPQELPLPGSGKSSQESPSAAFPVLGESAGVVYVVAPRYVKGDTLIWTSEDGGEKFSAAKEVSAYAEGSGVGDVLRNPISVREHPTSDNFDVASFNSSVGFTEVGDLDKTPFSLRFAADGDGQGSTLGFTGTGLPVEAYWNFASPYEVAFNYAKGGNLAEEANWSAPQKASNGYEPRLASGPSGLFLLSTDVASGEEQPTLLDVRKYNEATHSFGAPVNVTTVAPGVFSLFNGGGFFENPENGRLYVAQPIEEASGSFVMELWESTDAGASFHGEREVATVNGGYEGPPRLAVAADGQGWLTFTDGGGLEVADLNQLQSPTTTTTSTPVTTVSPPVVLAPTKLTTVQSGAGVNGGSLTVPQGTTVSDQAQISGPLAASATGGVTYTLYKDSKCTLPYAAGSTAPVGKGVAGPSAPVDPKAGRYYWEATYSGDAANAGSTSACGSEILVVALSDPTIGLPPTNVCLSRRHFVVHPRAPKNVTLVSVEIQINGKIVKRGTLSKRATTVSLVGLPKGTFRVALVTKSSKGKLYEDIRTYHTCVAGKHKKKK